MQSGKGKGNWQMQLANAKANAMATAKTQADAKSEAAACDIALGLRHCLRAACSLLEVGTTESKKSYLVLLEARMQARMQVDSLLPLNVPHVN